MGMNLKLSEILVKNEIGYETDENGIRFGPNYEIDTIQTSKNFQEYTGKTPKEWFDGVEKELIDKGLVESNQDIFFHDWEYYPPSNPLHEYGRLYFIATCWCGIE
jgi:hypothetical protein